MAKMDDRSAYGFSWPRALKGATDETVRAPLWEFPPEAVKAVIHERRVRFGWDMDEEEGEF